MFTYNDIANLFFVIVNNISYNKIEVENILVLKKIKKILKKEGFFKKHVVLYKIIRNIPLLLFYNLCHNISSFNFNYLTINLLTK